MGQKPGILIKYPQSNGNWPIPISHLPILGRIMLDLKLWGSSNLYYVHLRTVARLYDCTTYIWVVRRCSSYEFLYGSSMFIDPRQRWLKLRTGECPRSVGDSGGWPCENCSRRLEDFVKGEGPRKWYFIIYNIIYNYIYIILYVCVCSQKVRLDLSFKNGGLSIANGDSNRFDDQRWQHADGAIPMRPSRGWNPVDFRRCFASLCAQIPIYRRFGIWWFDDMKKWNDMTRMTCIVGIRNYEGSSMRDCPGSFWPGYLQPDNCHLSLWGQGFNMLQPCFPESYI
jgi:hypothetical protein